MRLDNCQGTVVGVIHDQVLVNYDGEGVLFLKNVLTRAYKIDEIVQFSAVSATAVDIEVGDEIAKSARYDVKWKGSEIKFIKLARTIRGGGVVLKIDPKGQFMFVDWKFSAAPPALVKIENIKTSTNILCPKMRCKPKTENLNEVFKVGQRVQYYAKEQAPSKHGVCWKAQIVADMEHDLITEDMAGRTYYHAIKKSEMKKLRNENTAKKRGSAESGPSSSSSSASTVQYNSSTSNQVMFEKPPNVGGYDFYDCSLEACQARFKAFAEEFRANNPNSILAKPQLEGLLQLQYLNHVEEQMSIIRAATSS